MRLRKITYALFIIATICLFTSCKKECKHQSIEWVIDKQATCTEEGIEHEECTKCHEKFDIKEIKKLKHICNDEGICTICGNKVATSGLIYKLNEDKKSYYVSEYIGIDIDIIIPAKYDGLYVTSIGDSAFSNFIGLTSIEIPNSVTSIKYGAFSGCIGLTSIEIPDSVTTIESFAFSGCIGLTRVEIPDSVKTIGTRAFNGCTGLTSIEIPSSVTIVDYCAFDDCDNISYNIYDNGKYLGNTENPYLVIVGVTNNTTESFSINPNTKLIGGGVFSKCRNLKSIEIPDGVTSIGVSAFNWCGSLKSIKIPDSVTSIGNSVFSGCTSLKSIEIPNSVTSIGDSAFRGCINLTSIIIPNSVTSMGDEVFNMCKAITVYCEALEKPSGWSEWWNYSNYGNCYVVWGYKKN